MGTSTSTQRAKSRSTIPAGMTRSRGKLIPASKGQCEVQVDGDARCHNPGRWTREGLYVCSIHKGSKAVARAKGVRSRKAA